MPSLRVSHSVGIEKTMVFSWPVLWECLFDNLELLRWDSPWDGHPRLDSIAMVPGLLGILDSVKCVRFFVYGATVVVRRYPT